MRYRNVVGFEGYYKVSDCGKVLSNYRGITLKPKIDKDGYHEYCLTLDGSRYYRRGHRLVAEAFIPNNLELEVVNHINSDKADNRVCNLEWCTVLHNNMHAIKHNNKLKTLSSYSKKDLEGVIEFYKDNDFSINQVITQLNLPCSHEDLRRLLRGESFKSLLGLESSVIKVNDYTKAFDILKLKYLDNLSNKEICKATGKLESYVSRVVNRKRLPQVYDEFMEEHFGNPNN